MRHRARLVTAALACTLALAAGCGDQSARGPARVAGPRTAPSRRRASGTIRPRPRSPTTSRCPRAWAVPPTPSRPPGAAPACVTSSCAALPRCADWAPVTGWWPTTAAASPPTPASCWSSGLPTTRAGSPTAWPASSRTAPSPTPAATWRPAPRCWRRRSVPGRPPRCCRPTASTVSPAQERPSCTWCPWVPRSSSRRRTGGGPANAPATPSRRPSRRCGARSTHWAMFGELPSSTPVPTEAPTETPSTTPTESPSESPTTPSPSAPSSSPPSPAPSAPPSSTPTTDPTGDTRDP